MGISMYNNSSLSVYIKIKQFMVKETTTNLMIWFIIYQFEIVCLWNCLPSTWLHDFYAGELHRLQSSPFDAEINVLNAFQNVMTKKKFLYLQQDRLIYLNDFWTRLPCSRVGKLFGISLNESNLHAPHESPG